MIALEDLNVEGTSELDSPLRLHQEFPVNEHAARTVAQARADARSIVRGEGDRLLVIVGPCSIHDEEAALEYAQRLARARQRYADDLHLVMRVYFEKPRTTVGWKGLINDPQMDGSFQINGGLRRARGLLCTLNELGVPCATEFLDLITPQFFADLVTWGAIGARTTESQGHRELASGLSCPVGFKNGTAGNIQVAVDAVTASATPHSFVGVNEHGAAAIVHTKGNQHTHVILRGGALGPNFQAEFVEEAAQKLRAAGSPSTVMVDCSHGNSNKDYRRQPLVAQCVAEQLASGGDELGGVMIESHLMEGAQKIVPGAPLRFGQSVTDGCISWETTEEVFKTLARGVRARRRRRFRPLQQNDFASL